MKLLAVIVIATLSGVGGYVGYFRCATAPTEAMLAKSNGEMEWLQREYHLSEAQFDRIQQLHREYAPKCDLMCARISKANAKFEELIARNKTYTPEVDAALKECLTVQGDCRQALLAHVYAVSAEMSPEDGARYLAMMKSRMVEPGLDQTVTISKSPR